MKLRNLCVAVLSVSLIISNVSIAFADPLYSTDSGISFDDHLRFMSAGGYYPADVASEEAKLLGATAADPPDGSSSNPFYVKPTGTNSTWYYYDYENTMQSSNHSYTNFNSMFAMLSQMIANDFLNLAGYFDDIWLHGDSWNLPQALDYIQQGLFTGTNNEIPVADVVNDIWSEVVDLTTIAGNTSVDVSGINNKLTTTNSTLGSIKTNSDTVNSRWSWNSVFNSTFTLPRYRQNYEGGTGSDLSLNPTGRSIPNQIWYWIATMNSSLVYGLRDLVSCVSVNNTQQYQDYLLQYHQLGRKSLWSDIRELGINLSAGVSRLAYVLASDEEIAARAAAADTQDAAVNQFVSPSSGNSLGVGDIVKISNIASTYGDMLDSNVQPSAAFGSMSGDSHAWDWFTSQVADSLDTTQRNRSINSVKGDCSVAYPLVNNYFDELQKIIGVKLW